MISPRDPETPAALLATAGTTGHPRLAVLSHRALLSRLDGFVDAGVMAADDTVLALLPEQHAFWLTSVLGGVLRTGAKLVIDSGGPDAGAPEQLLELIATERVTQLWGSPEQLRRLADRWDEGRVSATASLRRVISTGGALSRADAERIGAVIGPPVVQLYALTEAGPGVAFDGSVLPGVEVRIDHGAGEPGEPGEISLRSDGLFSGYWPDGDGGPDAEGWFATGDIGYLSDGRLRLLDRDRDRLTVAGFPVYPREVEEVIDRLPGVLESAVVGVPAADGERLAAVVVGPSVSRDDLLAHCREALPAFKRPRQVELWDALPRGATGKIRRSVVRERLTGTAR